MLATDTLTEAQWQIADAIARQLVLDGADVNEVQKAIAYLRSIVDKENAGKQFFDYLKTLVRHGDTIGHSKRTVGYYRALDNTCSQYLTDYQNDAHRMLFLLGWAARLVKYYKEGVPTGELTVPEIKSEREIELQAVAEAHSFEVGQTLEATITAMKGNKVTYEMIGGIKKTVKKHKKASDDVFFIGNKVEVTIIELGEDGLIRKIKPNI